MEVFQRNLGITLKSLTKEKLRVLAITRKSIKFDYQSDFQTEPWNIQTDLYKNCLDVADVLSCAYNRLGINNSRAVKCHNNGCFVVPYQYGVGRIKTWGNGEQMIDELTYKARKGCPSEGIKEDFGQFPNQLLFCLPQDKERPADIDQYLQYDRKTLPN